MSPSIDITPDMLGIYQQQVAPVSASVAADLQALCAALDLLQTGAKADLSALAGCLKRLADWLKNQQDAAPHDNSGWTSEPFGVKGQGGMVACRSDQWEVIFNQDGSGQPYLGIWQSRLPGETSRNGSFQIQATDGGVQLILEGTRPLRVSLPGFEAATWGTMDAFYQGLNSRYQPTSLQEESPAPGLPTLPPSLDSPRAPSSPDVTPTIFAQPSTYQPALAPLPSENSARKPAPGEQPATIHPTLWQCSCGSKNTGAFCPKCGNKKPAVCRQCGAALSRGARFCRNCGAEVRD